MRIIAFILDPLVIERMESLPDPAFGDAYCTWENRSSRRQPC